MLQSDGIEVFVRRTGAEQPYNEWSRNERLTNPSRKHQKCCITVRPNDRYEIGIKFLDKFTLWQKAAVSSAAVRFPESEVDALQVYIKIDDGVATQDLLIHKDQLRGKDHVVSAFRCTEDGQSKFLHAPVEFTPMWKARLGWMRSLKHEENYGTITVTFGPGRVTNLDQATKWPPMQAYDDLLEFGHQRSSSDHLCTRPVYRLGKAENGLTRRGFNPQRTSGYPVWSFEFQYVGRDAIEDHKRRSQSPGARASTVNSEPLSPCLQSSAAAGVGALPLKPNTTSILSTAQKTFLLELIGGTDGSLTMKNALKTYMQGPLGCPLDLNQLKEEIKFNPKLSSVQFAVRVLDGISWFDRTGYHMAAHSLRAFLTEAIKKRAPDDEMGKILRQMVTWPSRDSMPELWREAERQLKFETLPELTSYSTKADTMTNDTMSPSPKLKHKLSKDSQSRKSKRMASSLGFKEGVPTVKPPILKLPKPLDASKQHRNRFNGNLPAPTSLRILTRSRSSSASAVPHHLGATKPAHDPFFENILTVQTSKEARRVEVNSTKLLITEQSAATATQKTLPPAPKEPAHATSVSEIQEMNIEEIQLEAKIKKNEITLHERRGGDKATKLELQITRLNFEIELEHRTSAGHETKNNSNVAIELKIKQLEYEKALRELKKENDGRGGEISDVDIEKEIELDKLRLKLERRNRLSTAT